MAGASRPTVAMPIGDPAGIGPEIVLRALLEPSVTDALDIVVVGEPDVLVRHASACNLPVTVSADAIELPGDRRVALHTVPALESRHWRFGEIGAITGHACHAYAVAAIGLVQAGEATAVVAAPHTEASVNQAGIRFRGYPGLVAEMTGTPSDEAFLMLLSPVYRVVNLTLHEPVLQAAARVDRALVLTALRATREAMAKLGLPDPLIGVCGLNPHAGEGGLMGTEDDAEIAPAVRDAMAEGIRAEGPLPADALFAGRRHDVYLAMYHDQGHIPVKVASPLQATAITIGTPVPFGSVAHGSALDIAGQGKASPRALIQAVLNLAGIPG